MSALLVRVSRPPPRVHPPHHQERVRPAGPQQLGAVALGAGRVVRLVGPLSFGHVVGEFVMAMAPAHYHHQLPVQCTLGWAVGGSHWKLKIPQVLEYEV